MAMGLKLPGMGSLLERVSLSKDFPKFPPNLRIDQSSLWSILAFGLLAYSLYYFARKPLEREK
jgi:hypothetical protein